MPRLPEEDIYTDNMVATTVILVLKNAMYAIPVISLALQREDSQRLAFPVTWVLTIQIQNLMENQSTA